MRVELHDCLAAGCPNRVADTGIMCSFHWLGLPRIISDRIRREFCVSGQLSQRYRDAVKAAEKYYTSFVR